MFINSYPCRRQAAGIFLLIALVLGRLPAASGAPFPPLYTDRSIFDRAICESRAEALSQPVTGITVPHHLLAVDLLADAFQRVRDHSFRLIIILGPDHFSRSRTPFAVCDRDLMTCCGLVPAARPQAGSLLKRPRFSSSNLFSHEHAVQAITPFCARFFPGVPVLAVAIRNDAGKADWDALYDDLAPFAGSGTLVIQSTDFSHFLPPSEARRCDQETLRILGNQDAQLVGDLSQPRHVDSRGALYLQMRLQREAYGAAPLVLADRNSQEYSHSPVAKTTSYLEVMYSPAMLEIPHAATWVFAGDTFFGRYMARRLANPARGPGILAAARAVVGSASLILNLEGVLDSVPPQVVASRTAQTPFLLSMNPDESMAYLRGLGVRAVIVENNHRHDCGTAQFRNMCRGLENAGITVVDGGTVHDFGPFSLMALTDLDNSGPQRTALLTASKVASLPPLPVGKPAFAFVHWGSERRQTIGKRERAVASWLKMRGIELVIGCHPHVAGELEMTRDFACVSSLGNFLFDQSLPPAGGSILELRFFPQGTYFARLCPIGNLYAGRGR